MTITEKLKTIKERDKVIKEAYLYYRNSHPDWQVKKILFEIGEKTGYSKNTIYRVLKNSQNGN